MVSFALPKKYRVSTSIRATTAAFQILSSSSFMSRLSFDANYVGVLTSLWLFLFAAQPKEFFFVGLKKLEQRSHKCVELRGDM
jgi:hypothetical protein